MAKRKELIGAKVRVRYGNDIQNTIEIEGIWRGTQVVAPNDYFFLLLETEETDRFIPLKNVIHVDILESEVHDVDEEKEDDGYIR